jgi:hypothetical protein
MYGAQNDPMIDIIIVKDFILVLKYIIKIKFEGFCDMSIVDKSYWTLLLICL